MPDFPLPEDDAALYVIDALSVAERRDFEARLAQSAELRTLVRELEEGAVALALASPKRQPPRQVWNQIEKAVAAENKQENVIAVFSFDWWRNGWPAAAACLIGWIIYALWLQRPSPSISSEPILSNAHTQRETAFEESARTPATQASIETNAVQHLLQLGTLENADLRQQIAGLENRLTFLSQSLAQQRALLGESNRLKFFQMAPVSNGNAATGKATLSPALQRAVFLAMARELGWLSSSENIPSETGGPAASGSGATNQFKVDFVDLRPGTHGVSNPPQSEQKAQTEITEQSAPSPTTPGNIVPVIAPPGKMIVAIDPATAPKDSHLTFLDDAGNSLGTATMGNNPLVATLPVSGGGTSFTIISETPSGQSNVIQFSAPETTNP